MMKRQRNSDDAIGIEKEGSDALRGIVGNDCLDSFFKETWQLHPQLYQRSESSSSSSPSRKPNSPSPWISNALTDESHSCPSLDHTISMGWNGITSLLQNSQTLFTSSKSPPLPIPPPLIFRSQSPLPLSEIESTYNSNPFSAYLDGCSIVINHADLLCPHLASLCLELQKSFPHCYANAYLTPPGSRAVTAHADDRDVIVLQIAGKKEWSVYRDVPVPYPYPHEQAGKNDVPVPLSVLASPPGISATLEVGDALYMPRGYVHEAFTKREEPSFHATVAIATHDWSLAKIVAEKMRRRLDEIPAFRMAVGCRFGMAEGGAPKEEERLSLEGQIEEVMRIAREEITVESVSEELGEKYRVHNERVRERRMTLINQRENQSKEGDVGGPLHIEMDTRVRASTAEERDAVRERANADTRSSWGLTVREETCDSLLSILSFLKEDLRVKLRVDQFRHLIQDTDGSEMVCDLTLLSFARCCVELGAMVIVK